MKTIECKCTNCEKLFDKPLNEYKRSMLKQRPLYCSRSCCGKSHISNFGEKRNTIPPAQKNKANPFRYYFRNCNKRNQEVDIDIEYLENVWNNQNGTCPYTKIKLNLNTHKTQYKDFRYTASLDRIDNSKGYIKGNVQFISTAINYMKNIMTDPECKDFIKEISNNVT